MEHLDYLKWFLIFAWAPTLVVWIFKWRLLTNYWRVLGLVILGCTLIAFPWDYWATHSWLWHFSTQHTLGLHFLGLPVEEFIFFSSEALLYASLALVLRDSFKKRKLV